MKKIISLVACTYLATVQPALAHEGVDHSAATAKPARVDASDTTMSVAAALVNIHTSLDQINAQIDANNMNAVHEESEKMEVSVAAIKAKASQSDGDKKQHLEAAIGQFNAQLGKLHTASDKNDTARAKIELKKAYSALKLIENDLK